MRFWRWGLLACVALLMGAAGTVLAVAVNVATSGEAPWFPGMDAYPLCWLAGSSLAGVAATLAWRAVERWYDARLGELVPAAQRLEPWVVDRPAELKQVVAALCARRGRTAGITTVVHGTGGFGKTTLAQVARCHRRVLRRFGSRVYWVPLGRDSGGDALAGLVNGLITQIDPARPGSFTSVRQASDHLAALLARGPRRLLVLDDIWTEEQLAAFPVAGRCARLVTTRVPNLAAGQTVPVRVDQMSHQQALTLLQAGLPPLPPPDARALVQQAGRWPLLLRLSNTILADQHRLQRDVPAAARELLSRLRADGALQADVLTGAARGSLDVTDPVQRARAVRATIMASTGLLSAAEHARLAELSVFTKDEAVPVELAATLWAATGGTDGLTAGALAGRLADLALITLVPGSRAASFTMHDVIRDYLRKELSPVRLTKIHQELLDAAAAAMLAPAGPRESRAWWDLPAEACYLRGHLIEHLLAAGLEDEAENVATDLRWASGQLLASGPAAPYADLVTVGTPRAMRLARLIGQSAHLLSPADPPESVAGILFSRTCLDPDWGPQASDLIRARPPALTAAWPPPDLPDPALRRTLFFSAGKVTALAAGPGGAWLAVAGMNARVTIWDTGTWTVRHDLTGIPQPTGRRPWWTQMAAVPDGLLVRARDRLFLEAATGASDQARATEFGPSPLFVSPGGRSVAFADPSGSIVVKDAMTGQASGSFPSARGKRELYAVAADGSWIVVLRNQKSLKLVNAANGTEHHLANVQDKYVLLGGSAVAAAVEGSWLAVLDDGNGGRFSTTTVGVFDTTTGERRAELAVSGACAVVAPAGGGWLAVSDYQGIIRVWDSKTWAVRAVLTGGEGPYCGGVMTAAPDGSWLAAGDQDGVVRIWDVSLTGPNPTPSDGYVPGLTASVAAPDGTWVAANSDTGEMRAWDAAGKQYPELPDDRADFAFELKCRAMAVPLDGSWVAARRTRDKVLVRDTTTWQVRATLPAPENLARYGSICACSPDGTWLAVSGARGEIQVWETETWGLLRGLNGRGYWRDLVAAPDGAWLAAVSENFLTVWDAATWQVITRCRGLHGTDRLRRTSWQVIKGTRELASEVNLLKTHGPRAALEQILFDMESAMWGTYGRAARARPVVAPDGTWFVTTAFSDPFVRLWDTGSWRCRRVLAGHDKRVSAMTVAPDGAWLATADAGMVRIWDPLTGAQRASFNSGSGEVNAMTVAPDGAWLATAGADGTLRVWDPATGWPAALMRVEAQLRGCWWSPCGHRLTALGQLGLYGFEIALSTTASQAKGSCLCRVSH